MLPASARRSAPLAASAPERTPPMPFSRNQIVTVVFIVALIATLVASSLSGLNLDVGVLCFSFGALLFALYVVVANWGDYKNILHPHGKNVRARSLRREN